MAVAVGDGEKIPDEDKAVEIWSHNASGGSQTTMPSTAPTPSPEKAATSAEPLAQKDAEKAELEREEAGAAQSGVANAAAAAPPPEPAFEDSRTRLETILIMLSLCSALFLGALDVTIVTVAIPTIAGEFNSTIGYTWIGSAYLLSNAATAPSWGKISDIWGRKQVLLLAVGIFWIGSLLCAVSVSMTMLIVARAFQGIGSGGIIILVNVCISDLFSMRKRGQYFGLTGLVWAVAGGMGPVIGGAFTTHVSWRWCFYINLPISGAGFILLLFVLKLHNPKTGMREGLAAVDWLGSLTVVGGTLMLLLGLTFGGVVFPWRSATVICLLVFGAVTIVLFAIVEWRFAKYPVIPLRLFKRRVAIASFGCCFFHGMVFVSGSYYLPLYYQAVLGASPLLSGVYVLPYSLGVSFSSAATGIGIRKSGKYLVFIITGFVFLTLGYGLFTDLGSRANWAKIVVYQLIASIGVGPNFQAPLISLQTTVQQRDVASATATFGFIRQLSTSISVVIGGVVFQNGMQKQYASLVASIGQQAANLLSGSSAASSVYAVDALSGSDIAVAREAYWKSMQTMYIMYAAFAGAGLVVSCFITQTTLSKDHKEHKTGLNNMRKSAQDSEETEENSLQASGDEEKGASKT